jgi:hypothetical protein
MASKTKKRGGCNFRLISQNLRGPAGTCGDLRGTCGEPAGTCGEPAGNLRGTCGDLWGPAGKPEIVGFAIFITLVNHMCEFYNRLIKHGAHTPFSKQKHKLVIWCFLGSGIHFCKGKLNHLYSSVRRLALTVGHETANDQHMFN